MANKLTTCLWFDKGQAREAADHQGHVVTQDIAKRLRRVVIDGLHFARSSTVA